MPKFSVRISWYVVFEILASSSNSWMVKWQLEWITFQTFWMFSSFFDVESYPEHSLSSIIFVKLMVSCLLMASFPNGCFNIVNVSENIFPNLKQNFTPTHFSWRSPILNCWKICQGRKTCLHPNRYSTMTKQTQSIQFAIIA